MSMNAFTLLWYLEPVCCGLVLLAVVRAKAARNFLFFSSLLAFRLGSSVLCMGLLQLMARKIEVHLVYKTYFYVYWSSYALTSVLNLLIILSVFRLAMAPLKGLQTLGMLVFKWAAAISIAISLGIAVGPHQTGTAFMISMMTQLQQTSSILTLCLLMFVCFAIRPMGLSFRSRIFGVSLGLGVMATANLISSAWISHAPGLNSIVNASREIIGCLTLLMWSAYFAFPEEKRRMIVLPTTSPFLRWNQISEVLGDAPGFVAIAGVPPEVFAPAELEVMRRASAKMPEISAGHVPEASAITLRSLIA